MKELHYFAGYLLDIFLDIISLNEVDYPADVADAIGEFVSTSWIPPHSP